MDCDTANPHAWEFDSDMMLDENKTQQEKLEHLREHLVNERHQSETFARHMANTMPADPVNVARYIIYLMQKEQEFAALEQTIITPGTVNPNQMPKVRVPSKGGAQAGEV